MNVSEGCLVLFQFDNLIIASANLQTIEKYDSPFEGQYYGSYKFDINTVKIFQPITIAELNKIDSSITRFSQSKQEINVSCWPEIDGLIKRKEMTFMAEELPAQESPKLIEGAKKQVLVNAYERNYKARQRCIEYYGCFCSVCGFDFVKSYGDEFEGKIHVHHLKALSEVNEEYEVDPINDLRPVCPNCHLALHSKVGDKPYSIEELKEKIYRINSSN
ncbi:HNH endonuclease [Bacillus sp. AG4(2022)]|uniref:HNH endonuclease n=1 Tax=Bacillus sp. AG4(2022) TaxID=2962594 RepID=UPI002882CC57|nr:HNH endonuclease [Bacillus sp. AG4(2022)]MDT0160686.1 HNH endonuclease [Bacillus sp. AG4(2022)]